MVVDAIPCGSDCYRPEDNKAGQIRAGAIANNLSSLRVSYPGAVSRYHEEGFIMLSNSIEGNRSLQR